MAGEREMEWWGREIERRRHRERDGEGEKRWGEMTRERVSV